MAVFRQATGAYAPFRARIYWAFHASESQTAVMEASTGTYAPFRTQKWPDCGHFWRKIGTPGASTGTYAPCSIFGHRGDRLKAVFDSAESPLQAALPQG